jgi:hypothetical protein
MKQNATRDMAAPRAFCANFVARVRRVEWVKMNPNPRERDRPDHGAEEIPEVSQGQIRQGGTNQSQTEQFSGTHPVNQLSTHFAS